MAHTVTRPPDIVLFLTDQQRFDQLGYASDGHFETPNLDRIARSGVIFENAYSASTVCVPSRVALLTGIEPHRVPTQDNGMALREGFWTVAHALKRAGYETALIGKAHFAPIHAQHGFDTMRLCEHLQPQGLGELSRERGDEVDDYHRWLLANGYSDWRIDNMVRKIRQKAERTVALAEVDVHTFPHSADVHPTGWVERETMAFLEARDTGRPLFLVVSFPHPHAPYNPPEPYASMFDPRDSQLPVDRYEVNEGLPLAFQLAFTGAPTRAAAAGCWQRSAAWSSTSTTPLAVWWPDWTSLRRWSRSRPTTETTRGTGASSRRPPGCRSRTLCGFHCSTRASGCGAVASCPAWCRTTTSP
jgi:hypothetical protein